MVLINGIKIFQILFIIDGAYKVDIFEDFEAVLDSDLKVFGEGIFHEFSMNEHKEQSVKRTYIIMQGLLENTVGEKLATGLIGFFLFLVIEGLIEEALDVDFVELFEEDLRVAVVNGQEVFEEVKDAGVLVVLVEVDLNAGEELLDHDVEAEVVVPAAEVELLFVGAGNVGVKLVGEVD